MTPKQIAENAATTFAGRTYRTPEEAHADLAKLILAAATQIKQQSSFDDRGDLLSELRKSADAERAFGNQHADLLTRAADHIEELRNALEPFAQIGDIVNDSDVTAWNRCVAAGCVRRARELFWPTNEKA